MRDLVVRLWRLYQTPAGRKMFRYTMVSVVSTVVSLSVLVLVYGVIHAWSEVPDTILANCAATVPSYFLTRNWAWGKSGRSHIRREVIPFWAVAVAGIGFSVVTATLARDYGIDHHLGHLTRTVLVVGANVAAFGILWVLKFLFFNRLFHVAQVGVDQVDVAPLDVATLGVAPVDVSVLGGEPPLEMVEA